MIVVKKQRKAQQINGREGETVTLLSRFSVNSELRGFGFAPRHLNRWASSFCQRKFAIMLNHDEKPERGELSEDELRLFLESLNSPYHKHIQNLENHVVGKTVLSSTVGFSGFLLFFDDSSWVLSFVDDTKLNWRVGSGEPSADDLKLLDIEEYGNGRNPLAVNLPYADEICDVETELAEAHGKPIVGLAIGECNYNFCFPEKRELDVMLVSNAENQTALRIFWEQW